MNEDDTALPADLRALIDLLATDAAAATVALEGSRTAAEVAAWQAEMQALLARGGQAALLLASGGETLTAPQTKAARDYVRAQFGYLDAFAADIVSADAYREGWEARAKMYAESIKEPYWRGKTRMLPLPAMPTQGTQCVTRCGCSWEIEEAEDRYNCYWRLGTRTRNCQTCIERSAQWAPYVIRKDEL